MGANVILISLESSFQALYNVGTLILVFGGLKCLPSQKFISKEISLNMGHIIYMAKRSVNTVQYLLLWSFKLMWRDFNLLRLVEDP